VILKKGSLVCDILKPGTGRRVKRSRNSPKPDQKKEEVRRGQPRDWYFHPNFSMLILFDVSTGT
jgi:hypothetical protein